MKKNASEATEANPREIMPQTGGTNFDKTISAGQANVSLEPQGQQLHKANNLQAAHTWHREPILNEWLVLSGIIKD